MGVTLGNLDVGMLNSRNDSMKQKMQTDLWKAAQTQLQQYEEQKQKVDVQDHPGQVITSGSLDGGGTMDIE